MAGSVDVQLRNAQSAVLFMQQEHAKTLQGLHAELQKLQKKCSELTFELAMKSEEVDEEQYKEQQRRLESQLEEKQNETNKLESQVADGDNQIADLEQKLKLQEKRLLNEKSQYQQTISSLNAELDKKSANVAYLTNQLRQMALVRHRANGHRGAGPVSSPRVPSTSPQPPAQPPPPSHQRRRVRTPSLESVHVLKNGRVSAVAGTQSDLYDRSPGVDYGSRHTRRLSSPATTIGRSYDSRDIEAFLARVDTTTSDIDIKPAPPILPPISPFPQERGSSHSSPYYSRRALRVSKPSDSEHAAEVGSLAVQAVHRGKKELHATQRSNGDSP